jgi:hypothetical protein
MVPNHLKNVQHEQKGEIVLREGRVPKLRCTTDGACRPKNIAVDRICYLSCVGRGIDALGACPTNSNATGKALHCIHSCSGSPTDIEGAGWPSFEDPTLVPSV